jgi:diaminopimelate epimerase
MRQKQFDFIKMQTMGNDLVIVDASIPPIYKDATKGQVNSEFVKTIADRHYGIGCDQVLIIGKSTKADVSMQIYNADGSSAGACGNGARCVAWLWMQKINKSEVTVEVAGRVLHAWSNGDYNVSVDLLEPEFNRRLTSQIQKRIPATFVSIGNPHLVVESLQYRADEVLAIVSDLLPNGVNIEWLTVVDRGCISIKIYERGAGETHACGTGACAAAVVAISKKYCDSSITVLMPGGEVRVDFERTVVLTGDVSFVFEGKIDYSPPCVTSSPN